MVLALYPVVAPFVKVTLLVFYLRVFSPLRGTVAMIWTSIGVIILFYIVRIALYIYFTLPLGSETREQQLFNFSAAQGIFSIVTDFYVLIVPIKSTLGLHLPIARKMAVCAVFATGFLYVFPRKYLLSKHKVLTQYLWPVRARLLAYFIDSSSVSALTSPCTLYPQSSPRKFQAAENLASDVHRLRAAYHVDISELIHRSP